MMPMMISSLPGIIWVTCEVLINHNLSSFFSNTTYSASIILAVFAFSARLKALQNLKPMIATGIRSTANNTENSTADIPIIISNNGIAMRRDRVNDACIVKGLLGLRGWLFLIESKTDG